MGGAKKTLGWVCILKGLTRFVINALYTLYYEIATSSLCNGKYSYKEIYFGFDLLFVHLLMFLWLLSLYVDLNRV